MGTFDAGNLFKSFFANPEKLNGMSNNEKKPEVNSYVSGWDAVNAQKADEAKASDFVEDVSMASLMGAEFGKTTAPESVNKDAVFSDEEVSLENLMSLLDDDVDREKLARHNAKGTDYGRIVSSGIDSDFAHTVADGLESDVNIEKFSAYNSDPINDRQNGVKKNPEEFGDEVAIASMLFALSDDIWA